MNKETSPYYPPRAGWSRHLYSAAYSARRHLHLENLHLPRLAIHVSLKRAALCLLLPGYSFYDAGWRRIGLGFALGWLVAGAVFLMWLGYTAASIAFGLMMSFHVSGVLHFLNRISPSSSVLRRLALSIAILFVVGQLIYGNGLNWFQSHLFMPLEANGKIYIVNPRVRPTVLHRGDWLAFRVERTGGGAVYIRGGFVLDRVIAEPGDTVEFGSAEFSVNGESRARLPLMPTGGLLTIPEKTWLVWPSLRTVQRNNVSDDVIASTVLQMAHVGRDQMTGKPYRRWFWRKQTS